MAFQKGQSGNPSGKTKSEKLFKDALLLAVKRTEGDKTKLARIAEALVDKAIDGDVPAINAVADRLDGKAHQTTELTIDDKRDATDWTRAELVAFLNNARDGGSGTADTDGRSEQPDQVH